MQERKGKNRHLAKEHSHAKRQETGRRERRSALIVCEGKCTEPFYLRGLLQHLRISAANVEIIVGESQSNAVAVVNRARQRFKHTPRDHVFAMIDNEQEDLDQALKLCEKPLQRANKKNGLPLIRIEPILSTPCFEVWLLLHFRYCDKHFARYADVLPELQASLPGYQKSESKIFEKVGDGDGLGRALLNAVQLRIALAQTNSTSPATDMDKLVEALRALNADSH